MVFVEPLFLVQVALNHVKNNHALAITLFRTQCLGAEIRESPSTPARHCQSTTAAPTKPTIELELLLSGTGTTWLESLWKPCDKPIVCGLLFLPPIHGDKVILGMVHTIRFAITFVVSPLLCLKNIMK